MNPRRSVTYDVAMDKGVRQYQQDRIDVRLEIVPGVHYFAVFDGHGRKHGHNISTFLAEKMAGTVKIALEGTNDVQEALAGAFQVITRFLVDASETLHARHNGSTATVLLVDTVANKMTVAYCGDSLCLCLAPAEKRAGFLTPVIHKVENMAERERIVRSGGAVDFVNGTWRVVTEGYMLNLSRSIGDFSLAPAVSCVPMVLQHDIPDCPCYIVLASDGLWDVMDHRGVGKLLELQGGSLTAGGLVDAALSLRTADNTSVVLVVVS